MNKFAVIRIKLFALFSPVLLCVFSAAQSWVVLPNGLALLSFNSNGTRITVMRADRSIFDFTVEDVLKDLGSSSTGLSGNSYSLSQLADSLKPIALSNAGATNSFQIPAPVGLLRTRNRVSSPLNTSATHSGIFCVGTDDGARVFAMPQGGIDTSIGLCAFAVQGRPLLIEKGKLATTQLSGVSDNRSARTAVGVNSGSDVLIIVAEEISLRDFANALLIMHSLLGLTDAVNLDGSSSSGLMYQSGSGRKYVEVANTHGLIASAITVRTKPSLKKKTQITPMKSYGGICPMI